MARVPPSKLAHVVYRTHRFQDMLDWYAAVFGARVQHQDDALAFLTYDDEHHRFAFANLDVLKPDDDGNDGKGLVGVDHVAYSYDSVDDLLDAYEDLRGRGILPYWCVHHGITVSMYYRDPDGNQMEFQVDRFDSAEQTAGYMTGPAFAANPVGVEYDPEDWLTRRRAGVPASRFLDLAEGAPMSPIRGVLGE